jgi:dsRNA-specific ribonuclease
VGQLFRTDGLSLCRVSKIYVSSASSHAERHSMAVHGEEMGSCSAARRSEAKEAAAQQALDRLSIP